MRGSKRWSLGRSASLALLAALLSIGCRPAVGGAGQGAGAGAAGASPASAAAPSGTGQGEALVPLLKARSAYTTISAAAAPWWMAVDGGYFREQGLEVDLFHVDAGASLLAAMNNGDVDVTFSGAPTLALGYLQGMETMIIGSTSNTLDDIIFTRPEIDTIEKLRGKTIGVTKLKAVTDVAARVGLRRVGLVPDVDVFTRGTGGLAESLAALETGAVDGASLSVPGVFEARKRGFRELINVTGLGVSFMNSGVGATKRLLAERPEIGEPYLRALAQATSRLKTDRDFAVEVMAKWTRMDDRDLLGATVDHYRKIWTVDPYPEPAALQAVLDVEEHPAAATTRPEQIIDARFAEALRQSHFLDQLPNE